MQYSIYQRMQLASFRYLYLTRIYFSGYDLENYTDIKHLVIELRKRESEADLAESHLRFFMHDTRFIDLSIKVRLKILDLSDAAEKAIEKSRHIYATTSVAIKYKQGNEVD